jgi:hypothetical protein
MNTSKAKSITIAGLLVLSITMVCSHAQTAATQPKTKETKSTKKVLKPFVAPPPAQPDYDAEAARAEAEHKAQGERFKAEDEARAKAAEAVKESHEFAQKTLERAKQRRAGDIDRYRQLNLQLNAREDYGSPDRRSMVAEFKRLSDEIDKLEELIPVLELREQYADKCMDIYQMTADKKTSDLTTRENNAIKACTDLELYPPPHG